MTSLNRVLLIVAAIWGNVVWSTHASPASSQSRSPSLSQFCMDDKVYTFDLCMAFSHRRDDPSTYRLAFSGAFNKAHGWAALAHGSIMDGAIMFVFYPNRRADGLTVSVRSTTGHSPPKTLPQHNDNLKLLRTFVDGEGYYHAVIDCESCRLPPPGASAVQPNETWIWSANDYQVLTSDEPGEELQVHSSYGRFIVDVRPNDLDLDNITQHYPDRTNGGARGGNKQNTQGATAVQVHGILMLVVFVGIYPLGIVMIRSGLARAFRYHVGSQLAATLIVLLLAMLGAWSALKRDQASHHCQNTLDSC
ncbi:hypothetical protein QQS21_008257 [Conoideocrella luteorostrata]|uniref:Cellobiose dehydrogenase-like cytochrome domain-containing protein n=1 Tax=Conoideocrella luteorostrata TaxID=1105319 RepID=A0AAJ0CJ64_9HYPO|nr:hypothetical protein QQS21_008257 [Conoideocrella luteorostrata]